MKSVGLIFVLFLAMGAGVVHGQDKFPTDTVKTTAGDLQITFIGHGTLMFSFGGKVIQVDPVGQYADYAKLPKADLILITHEHRDHLDPQAVALLTKPGTVTVLPQAAAGPGARGPGHEERRSEDRAGLTIEAVPAYNLVHKRDSGEPFHPKGAGQRLRHHLRG